MKTHAVLVLEPGDVFVTEVKSQINTPEEKEIRRDVAYWKIDFEGKPRHINPDPKDVAAYLLGRDK
jgi:hypothetical protein